MERITTEMSLIKVREEKASNVQLLQCSYNRVFDKLQEIEVKKEQGLLIELPCIAGDIVYIVDTFFWENRTKCIGCNHFHEGSDIFRDNDCCTYSDEHDKENKDCLCISEMTATLEWILRNLNLFGKTIFLSRDKAEETIHKLKLKR